MIVFAALVPGDEGRADGKPDIREPPEPGRAPGPVEYIKMDERDDAEKPGPDSEDDRHDPHDMPGARYCREQHHGGASGVNSADETRMQRRNLERQEFVDLSRHEKTACRDPRREREDDAEEDSLPPGQRLGRWLADHKGDTDRDD